MPTVSDEPTLTPGATEPVHLVRWTVTSGSNSQSRGAVVLASGDHQWEASAEGSGPIAALFRAVDEALVEVLGGHPRLVAFDIHALTESIDSEGLVTLAVEPPAAARGQRARGRFPGTARNVNIIAASVEAYIGALNNLLAEEQWAGATDAAGNRRRAAAQREAEGSRVQLDEDEAAHDPTSWFNR